MKRMIDWLREEAFPYPRWMVGFDIVFCTVLIGGWIMDYMK